MQHQRLCALANPQYQKPQQQQSGPAATQSAANGGYAKIGTVTPHSDAQLMVLNTRGTHFG